LISVDELRAAGIQASFKEHLVLLEALQKDVIEQTPEAFYYLSRATFVKDEGLLDLNGSMVLDPLYVDFRTALVEPVLKAVGGTPPPQRRRRG